MGNNVNGKVILEIKELCKIYQKGNETINAISNMNYKFEKGKFYAIMGHSGSGKSTLINLLGLLEKKSSGEYFIDNKSIETNSSDEMSLLRMKKFGFIFQSFFLDDNLKAYENVILPMLINRKIKKEDREKNAMLLLKKLGIENRKNHYPNEMSGGECQRVAIARALANNPEVILADEPTGNLDEENEILIFSYLKELVAEGKTVIAVSHSNEILKYADITLKVKNGKMVPNNE